MLHTTPEQSRIGVSFFSSSAAALVNDLPSSWVAKHRVLVGKPEHGGVAT
jgi:hypothetical protein